MECALVAPVQPDQVSMVIRPKPDLAALEQRLGYVFKDRAPLNEALTHISAAPVEAGRKVTYQRLEFLGDRVLGLCISHMLLTAFPQAEEGDLSRRLADLVRKDSCADIAIDWEIGAHLKIGHGEAQSGARKNRAILADVCEGVIGAVFTDGGFEVALAVVQRSFGPRMLKPPRPLKDAKTALQEWAQAKTLPPPLYEEHGRTGPDHAPRFVIAVMVRGHEAAEATGKSKRLAEQAAAEAFMHREAIWNEIMITGEDTV